VADPVGEGHLARVRAIVRRGIGRGAIRVIRGLGSGIRTIPTTVDRFFLAREPASLLCPVSIRPSTARASAHRKEGAMKTNDVLARRLHAVRLETYGAHGGPLLAEDLGIPTRTWLRYKSGAPMPGLVLRHFIEVTGVEPHWLLTGEGRRYRDRTQLSTTGRTGV
jgi:hypothetical protein